MSAEFADHRPLVFAHRGASAELPENTLPAFARALELGVDAIELDVWLARDGVPVVAHDPHLHRTHGRGEQVNELDSGILKEQAVPLLAEVLELCQSDSDLLIELKGHDVKLVQKVIGLLPEYSNIKLLSFSEEMLFCCQTLAPKIPLVLNIENPLSAEEIDACPWETLSCDITKITSQFIQQAHQAKRKVWGYTCNDLKTFERLSFLKIDAVFSDDPAKLLQLS